MHPNLSPHPDALCLLPASDWCVLWVPDRPQHNTNALQTHRSRHYEPQLATATPVPTTTTANMFVQSGLTPLLNTLLPACLCTLHTHRQLRSGAAAVMCVQPRQVLIAVREPFQHSHQQPSAECSRHPPLCQQLLPLGNEQQQLRVKGCCQVVHAADVVVAAASSRCCECWGHGWHGQDSSRAGRAKVSCSQGHLDLQHVLLR